MGEITARSSLRTGIRACAGRGSVSAGRCHVRLAIAQRRVMTLGSRGYGKSPWTRHWLTIEPAGHRMTTLRTEADEFDR